MCRSEAGRERGRKGKSPLKESSNTEKEEKKEGDEGERRVGGREEEGERRGGGRAKPPPRSLSPKKTTLPQEKSLSPAPGRAGRTAKSQLLAG